MQPPTAYSCALVDTLNNAVYLKLFNDCIQSGEDASYIERIAHLIMVIFKLKSATVVGAMVPLAQSTSDGEKLASQMMDQNNLLEEIMMKIAATKKHPSNKEFIDLMGKFEQECKEAQEIEIEALQAVIKDIDEEKLIAAAADFEKCKLEIDLIPGKMEQ